MEFDFSQNTEVTDINKVPEDFRGLYKPKEGAEGSYVLNSDDETTKSAVAAITRLNSSLTAARKEAKENKAGKVDLTPLKDFGETPEDIAAAVTSKIEELTEQLTKGGDAKLNLEKIKEDLAKQHSKDLKGKDTKIEALNGQLEKLLVENAAKSAIADQKGDIDLLMPFVRDQIKVVDEDGEFKVFVVDGQGDRRYSGVTGEPMSINELVKDMKNNEKYGKLFQSEAPSGGGIKPGTTGKPKMQPGQQELTANQKIAQGLGKRSG